MNEIKVNAVLHVTKEELSQIPKDIILKSAIHRLSSELSEHIINKTGLFTTINTKDGLQMRAECYVLTPNDYSELVEKIQRDLVCFGPSSIMLGGISS